MGERRATRRVQKSTRASPFMIGWDALVAGAGSAGSLAALELARAGMRVALLDKSRRNGPKIGETLPSVGLNFLSRLGLDLSQFGTVHQRIRGNVISWASSELDATDFLLDPNGPGWRLSRHTFDENLRAAASAAGAQHFTLKVDSVERDSEYWVIGTKSGEVFRCRWLIDATGRSASIARRLGVLRVRDEGIIALYCFGALRPGEVFDRTLIEAVPEGWWYGALLPEGVAVLALHVDPRESRSVRPNWLAALHRTSYVRDFFQPSAFDGRPMAADASGSWLKNVGGTNWIACGDAAISFDPLSSQGIYNAIYSGVATAKAVLASESGDRSAIVEYVRRLAAIRRVYRSRLISSYGLVRRWPDRQFWTARHVLNHVSH